MALARTRRERGIDYWPGFVDALSTLLLGIIFLLSVFVVVQFFLSQEVTGKDTALQRLNAQIASSPNCSRWKRPARSLEDSSRSLRANLAAAESRARPLPRPVRGAGVRRSARRASRARRRSSTPRSRSARALAQVEVLNQQIAALRRQLAALEGALEASEQGQGQPSAHRRSRAAAECRAGAAGAGTVALPLGFLRPLREILGNRPDIRVVGDRFVFQSEVFFDAGQAVLKPEGRAELDKLAAALLELERQIPPDIAWVLRVDGHTDVRPIATPHFRRTGSCRRRARSRSCSI